MIKYYCDICGKEVTDDSMISLIMKGHFESPEIIESVCKECSRNIKTYIDNISKEQ